MDKLTWQAPELKELTIEQTFGGPASLPLENSLFHATTITTSNP
jgi:hypothetical protein